MKILDGSELAGYIKSRQLKQVRALRQSWRIVPRLAIVHCGDNPVVDTYLRLKRVYGDDILIEVDVYKPSNSKLIEQIELLNNDVNVHGIIVQLPLAEPAQTDLIINTVHPKKDVDGLRDKSVYIPATAMAIDWLLAGYNIELSGKKIAIVGKGRLVGAPLAKLWKNAGLNVAVCDSKTVDLGSVLKSSDIVVTATGVPGLIKSEMIRYGAVVVDAGTASENGKIIGDLSNDIHKRDDLTITPIRGGVGPLTVTALFDNVILATRKSADQKGQQDIR